MKKEDRLLKDVKDSVKLGITSVAGLGVVGAIGSNVPGSSGIQSSVSTGVNLANVGQMGKVGINLAKSFK